jgi:hypothetical protein
MTFGNWLRRKQKAMIVRFVTVSDSPREMSTGNSIEGETTIPTQVTQFIKEKLCACEIRNPSGSCCLGEINRIVQSLC